MNILNQLGRFLLVGGLATALHYCILFLLVHWSGFGAVFASSIGFAISAIFNYGLNRNFTFRSDATHGKAFPRFLAVALCGGGINAALIALLTIPFSVHYMLAQVVATIVTLVWNFIVNRLWTFGVQVRRAG